MDENSFWAQLPEEIMVRVLSLLPVSAIIRLQLVCKQWKSLISSNGFAGLWSKLSPPQLPPLMIMFQSEDGIGAYDPLEAKWVTLGVTFPVGITHRRILASDGGLICYGSFCETTQLLIVCNPITKSWRILPELGFNKERSFIGMRTDKSRNRYSIYVVQNVNDLSSFDFGLIKEEIRVMVYDSLGNCWSAHRFDEVDVGGVCKRDRAVWVNGVLFAVSLSGPPHGLSIYNAVIDKWYRLLLPFERSIPLSPSVLASNDKLIIAAGAWEFLPFSSFDIWELDKGSGKLSMLDSVRCATLEQVPADPLPVDTVKRIGSGDVLFFHARGMLCPFVCDLTSKTWKTLPRYHGPCLSKLDSLLFCPSFSAEV